MENTYQNKLENSLHLKDRHRMRVFNGFFLPKDSPEGGGGVSKFSYKKASLKSLKK